MRSLGNETLVIITAALVTSSRDNSKERDWANATTQTAVGCSVQPFLMSNKLIKIDNEDREWVQEFLRIYIPAGQPTPAYTDRIQWRTQTLDSYGPSQPWYHKGVLHHTQIIGRFREG